MRAAETIVAEVRRLMAGRNTPILVALDGASGSGKSTLARLIAAELGAVLVQSDDFVSAIVLDDGWHARPSEQRVAEALDWSRLRAEALEPLRAGRPARWHPFVFEDGRRPDGTVASRAEVTAREPTAVIVLDGVTSTRSELADLIDLAVLVEVPIAVQHGRIAARWGMPLSDTPFAEWEPAEQYYLTQVRPASSFDLVVTTDDGSDLTDR
jgi:para-aminobenzoate synthetase